MEGFLQVLEDVDARLERPRRHGLTEIRSPFYSVMARPFLQDLLETHSAFADGIKFKGGSASLMPKSFLKEIAQMAHQHGLYLSTGGWAEHVLQKGPSAFKQYIQDCKDVGFDILELNIDTLSFQEEELLRLIRLVKSEGLKAKPQLALGASNSNSFRNLEREMDILIRRAERCLEAGADMIMVDAEGITKDVDVWRTDLIARMARHLGLQRIMFEANEPESLQWFVNRYGSRVNLFVDHSQVARLECLRSRGWGYEHLREQKLELRALHPRLKLLAVKQEEGEGMGYY